jgi:formimidoylglutamate deiminase
LHHRKRNVSAHALHHESSAVALFAAAISGGVAAAGQPLAGIAVGQRADFITLDVGSSALLGIAQEHVLDALVLSGSGRLFESVFVGGEELALDSLQAAVATPFGQAMRDLWASPTGG